MGFEMESIINGKKYDTETAVLVGSYNNGLGYRDFNFVCEHLYLTKNNQFFLAGEGGANSKYSKSAGNNMFCGSSKIILLSDDEALNWMERHEDTDKIEKFFGDKITEG